MKTARELPDMQEYRWRGCCRSCGTHEPLFFLHGDSFTGYTCKNCFQTTQEKNHEQTIPRAR